MHQRNVPRPSPSPFENQSRACIVGRSAMVPAAGRSWATGHARFRTGDPQLPCFVPVVPPVVTRTVCLLWAFSVSLTTPKVSRRPPTISRCWNIPAGIPLCTTNQRLCMSKALARVSDAAAAVPAAAPPSLTALATQKLTISKCSDGDLFLFFSTVLAIIRFTFFHQLKYTLPAAAAAATG